jgi:hypothetical protein
LPETPQGSPAAYDGAAVSATIEEASAKARASPSLAVLDTPPTTE